MFDLRLGNRVFKGCSLSPIRFSRSQDLPSVFSVFGHRASVFKQTRRGIGHTVSIGSVSDLLSEELSSPRLSLLCKEQEFSLAKTPNDTCTSLWVILLQGPDFLELTCR